MTRTLVRRWDSVALVPVAGASLGRATTANLRRMGGEKLASGCGVSGSVIDHRLSDTGTVLLS